MSFLGNAKGWPEKPLVEVSPLKRGYDLPVSKRSPGPVPIYAANGKNGSHDVIKIKGPGVVTGRSGTIGKVHFVEENYWPLNTALYVTDFKGNNPKWVYYMLQAFRVERFVEGAGVPTLNRNLVHGEMVPVPPLPEQKRIAAILDKADAIRRKRQQAIELADQFLRSVFLDLFGDLSNHGAEKVLLGDAVIVDAPMVDPKLKEYLDLIHIGPDRIEKETGRLLPAITAREEGLISNKFLFDDRYVLYSKIRPYLKKCALAVGQGLCSADMYPIRPNEDVMTREFLWMLLLSGPFDSYVASLPGRANIPKLNRTELSAFEFWLPSLVSQLKFSEVVKQTNVLKEKLRTKNDSPNRLFGCLSQRAFAGEL